MVSRGGVTYAQLQNMPYWEYKLVGEAITKFAKDHGINGMMG